MFTRQITGLTSKSRLLSPTTLGAHTATCPSKRKNPPPVTGVCPGSKGGGGSKGASGLTRLTDGAPVRLGFIPEEWFLFFHSKTGVSGPYIFGLVLGNYIISKELWVMEHEYYCGLSIFAIIYYATTRIGKQVGTDLDKEVDATVAEWEKGRKEEAAGYENIIKAAQDAQWRAEGQKLLMDAKKENITMQLEAEYRERFMMVYKAVKGRMDYHVKRYRAEARIQQKWMIGWILENVKKAITPEFQQQALDRAIQDLAAAASRAK